MISRIIISRIRNFQKLIVSICGKIIKVLIEFQYRFLHQTLATNVSLVKMGYKDDIRCTFCHEEAENFTHLFWFCSKIKLFWKHLIASLKDCNCLSDDYLLNNLVVLGLKPDTSKNKAIINFVLLLARFYSWLCRSKGNIPTTENFKPFLIIIIIIIIIYELIVRSLT